MRWVIIRRLWNTSSRYFFTHCTLSDATEGLFVRRVVVTRHESVAELCKEREIPKIYNVYTSNGGTYARALENAFTIGTDVPITRPPQWFSVGHGRVHQPDECINVRYFMEGILHLAMIIEAVDRELDNLPSVHS